VLIRNRRDHARAVLWIQACAVLHNVAAEDLYLDQWSDHAADGGEEDPSEPSAEVFLQQNAGNSGAVKREQLKQILLGRIAEEAL